MWIVAVDPGETTGLAAWDGGPSCRFAAQETDPVAVGRWLDAFAPVRPVVVVEGFPGGGPRTAAAVHTLKILGFVEHYSRLLGLEVVVQAPQRRLHRVAEARRLLAAHPGQRHAADALAHAIAYAATQSSSPD